MNASDPPALSPVGRTELPPLLYLQHPKRTGDSACDVLAMHVDRDRKTTTATPISSALYSKRPIGHFTPMQRYSNGNGGGASLPPPPLYGSSTDPASGQDAMQHRSSLHFGANPPLSPTDETARTYGLMGANGRVPSSTALMNGYPAAVTSPSPHSHAGIASLVPPQQQQQQQQQQQRPGPESAPPGPVSSPYQSDASHAPPQQQDPQEPPQDTGRAPLEYPSAPADGSAPSGHEFAAGLPRPGPLPSVAAADYYAGGGGLGSYGYGSGRPQQQRGGGGPPPGMPPSGRAGGPYGSPAAARQTEYGYYDRYEDPRYGYPPYGHPHPSYDHEGAHRASGPGDIGQAAPYMGAGEMRQRALQQQQQIDPTTGYPVQQPRNYSGYPQDVPNPDGRPYYSGRTPSPQATAGEGAAAAAARPPLSPAAVVHQRDGPPGSSESQKQQHQQQQQQQPQSPQKQDRVQGELASSPPSASAPKWAPGPGREAGTAVDTTTHAPVVVPELPSPLESVESAVRSPGSQSDSDFVPDDADEGSEYEGTPRGGGDASLKRKAIRQGRVSMAQKRRRVESPPSDSDQADAPTPGSLARDVAAAAATDRPASSSSPAPPGLRAPQHQHHQPQQQQQQQQQQKPAHAPAGPSESYRPAPSDHGGAASGRQASVYSNGWPPTSGRRYAHGPHGGVDGGGKGGGGGMMDHDLGPSAQQAQYPGSPYRASVQSHDMTPPMSGGSPAGNAYPAGQYYPPHSYHPHHPANGGYHPQQQYGGRQPPTTHYWDPYYRTYVPYGPDPRGGPSGGGMAPPPQPGPPSMGAPPPPGPPGPPRGYYGPPAYGPAPGMGHHVPMGAAGSMGHGDGLGYPSARGAAPIGRGPPATATPTTTSSSGGTAAARKATTTAATTKPARKNKRSTRIDPNEPTKPQSAYVMYANEVRAEMRDMRLTFAELAKIVGDRWKSMQPDEKRQREEAASIAKSQYHHALGMYRSSQQYRDFQAYLQSMEQGGGRGK